MPGFRVARVVIGATVLCALSTPAGAVEPPSNSHQYAVAAETIRHGPVWGTPSPVVMADGMYFAGQPDAAGYAQAGAAGVTTVINIRDPSETDWDVGAAVAAAGMNYVNEPLLLTKQGIDAASAARIDALVQAAQGPVLVHCASGNRVALWWALHLAAEHDMGADSVVQLAEQAGMKTELAPLLRAHLR